MTRREIQIFFNKIYGRLFDMALSLVYDRQYRKLYVNNKVMPVEITKDDIKEYKKKWGKLSSKVNPIYLKLFSRYIGKDYNIIPEDIAHSDVESLLNPPAMRGYFEDKNYFDKILPKEFLPKVYIRRISGFLYDSNYNSIDQLDNVALYELIRNSSKIVVKVTRDTSSGLGVFFFEKKYNGEWRDCENNNLLTIELLNDLLGKDYNVQECLVQSEFMSKFSATSVNTLRILVYRSVKDNKIHVVNAIMRIGKDGSLRDNAHQGGAIIGISKEGKLNKFLCDQYGNKFSTFNNINFEKENIYIENWDKIVDFAMKVHECIIPHRCVNLDVMIDSFGNPKLIEFNIRSMGIWAYQFNNSACFAEFTDEVIDYCSSHKKEKRSEYLYM